MSEVYACVYIVCLNCMLGAGRVFLNSILGASTVFLNSMLGVGTLSEQYAWCGYSSRPTSPPTTAAKTVSLLEQVLM